LQRAVLGFAKVILPRASPAGLVAEFTPAGRVAAVDDGRASVARDVGLVSISIIRVLLRPSQRKIRIGDYVLSPGELLEIIWEQLAPLGCCAFFEMSYRYSCRGFEVRLFARMPKEREVSGAQ